MSISYYHNVGIHEGRYLMRKTSQTFQLARSDNNGRDRML